MNLMIVGFLALIFIGLFHRLILEWLHEALPILRARLGVALPTLKALTRSVLRLAGLLATHEGKLPPSQATVQIAVAALMLVAAGTFIVCDLAFAYATICALLGTPYKPLLSSYDQLLGLTTTLLPLVFASPVTDLFGWSRGRFVGIDRGRFLAFWGALLCFVMSLAVGAALALYRDGVRREESAVWFQSLPAVILVALAVLLLTGTALAFIQCESSFPALVALSLAVGGTGLGMLYFVLLLIDFAAEVAGPAVKTTLRSIEDRHQRPPKKRPYEAPVVEKPAVPVNGSNPFPAKLQPEELREQVDLNGGGHGA